MKNMSNIEDDGFEVLEDFLTSDEVAGLCDALQSHQLGAARGGVRNAEKKFESINNLVVSSKLRGRASEYLKGKLNLVRVIFFDKTPDNNWLVSWHQDKTIALSGKADIEGWGPWTVKDGTHHVQPPLDVLNNMITFRIHLDDTTQESGCLRVIKGSHKLGILSAAEIGEYVASSEPVECEVTAGSAFVMRPHLFHASSKATRPSNRRIVHVEYSGYELSGGLEWV